MKLKLISGCLLFLLVTAGAVVMAQGDDDGDCPALVEEALTLAETVCEISGTSELCYGHFVLDAQPQPGLTEFQFEQPGDVEPVTRVRSLRLSAMNTAEDIWGVAVMRVRALVVGEFDPEVVTFLVFGDVVVDNPLTIVELQAVSEGNIRQQPSTNAAIVGVLTAGESISADGRTVDSAWIRLRRDNERERAWVSAVLVEASEDIDALTVVEPGVGEDELVYGAMQAFYFRSGMEDAPCSEAPNSGMLIQTPEGEAEITLLMNEANIQLRATAYVQAEPGESMTVYVIEGQATVEVGGVERTLLPGTGLTVPLDEDGIASGPPTEPQPYAVEQVRALPVNLLERPVEVAQPLSQAAGVPVSGEWNFRWLVTQAECPNGQTVSFETDNPRTSVRVDEGGESFVMLLTRYNRDESGVYRTIFPDTSGNIHTYSVRATALDLMSGTAQIEYTFGCELSVPFELRLIRAGGA